MTSMTVSPAHALVHLSAVQGVATVTLARTAARNALVPEMLLDLCVALETAGRREDVHCVLLLSAHRDFSVGTDLGRLLRALHSPDPQAYAAELAGLLNQAMLSLMRLRQPVVVAAGGRVVGGALGLLLAADVVIAAEDARFAPEPPEAGLAPCGGWQALLPRLAGVRRARAGLLLAHEIDAVTARDWGIVTELAPPGGGRARYRERRQAQPCGRPGRAGSGTRGRAYALHRGARWR